MTTTETTPAERAKQIRARLAEIAPYPDGASTVTAEGLARYLAMRAQVIYRQQLAPDVPWDRRDVGLMPVLFAASHALRALEESDPGHAGETAREIWLAWEDGAGVGGWLWQYLGDETCQEIGALAEELGALQQTEGAPDGH